MPSPGHDEDTIERGAKMRNVPEADGPLVTEHEHTDFSARFQRVKS